MSNYPDNFRECYLDSPQFTPDEEHYYHVYDNAQAQLKRIVANVYQSYSEADFEDALDELLGLFDMKLPHDEPVITAKNKNTLLSNFAADLARNHAKNLRGE